MMSSLADQLLEAAVAGDPRGANPLASMFGGMGGPLPKAPAKPADKTKKKHLRKLQKQARKKSRK